MNEKIKVQEMTDAFATLDNCQSLDDVIEAMKGHTTCRTAEEVAGTWAYNCAKQEGFGVDRHHIYAHLDYVLNEDPDCPEYNTVLALDFAEYLANTIDTE